MLTRLCAVLLFCSAPAMAAHPVAPYFGVWTGTGSSPQGDSSISLTMNQLGTMISGNFSGRPKRGGKSYSGTYRAVPQQDGCYQVTGKVIGQPQNFEANACLQQDMSIQITSMLLNGTVTPNEKVTQFSFEFSTVIGSRGTGTMYKKGAAKPRAKKKRKVRKPVEEE